MATVQSHSGHNFELVQEKLSQKLIITGVERLILEKIESLSRKIDNLDAHVQLMIPGPQISTDDLQNCPNLPTRTIEELQICEAFCKDSALKLSIVLSRVGGRTVKEATENVLTELMVDTVAEKYNWAGTKRGEIPKLAIKTTRLVALIHDSLKNMKQHSRVERSEIEDPIKTWLKNAPSRIKRSKKSTMQSVDGSDGDN